MVRRAKRFWALLLAVALCAPAGWTQQKDSKGTPAQPLPPIQSGESSSKNSADADNPPAASPNTLAPDTTPVTSAQRFSLGAPGGPSIFLFPRLHFRQSIDTNPGITTSRGSQIDAASQVSGELSFERRRSRYVLGLGYAGGGTFYNRQPGLNQTFHQLNLTQKITWGRWALLLADQVGYLPESSFGFAGFNPAGGLGSGLGGLGVGTGLSGPSSNLNPVLVPNQSILTGRERRISNAAVGELQYSLSPRSVITAAGSFGILHFLNPGFVDNNQMMFQAGLSHLLNRQDTLGILYGYTRFNFRAASSERIETHVVSLVYGRRITGRLALQLGGGPRIAEFRTLLPNIEPEVSWNVGAMLHYARTRTNYSLSYDRSVTGGSGLFAGASSDRVQLGVDRKFSRQWASGFDFGYAHNSGFRNTNPGLNNYLFGSWYAGSYLSRPLGRKTSLRLMYRVQRQDASNTVCIAAGCRTPFLRQQFGLGLSFDWNLRPIEIH